MLASRLTVRAKGLLKKCFWLRPKEELKLGITEAQALDDRYKNHPAHVLNTSLRGKTSCLPPI